jgi:hypothetical protein
MFYTRPKLPQLGIDLVDVRGGLGRPSQYWGHMADGREVYLRYDNGWISVSVGNSRDQLEEELLGARIGPMFNGDMLLEQICDLTGITIRGEKQSLSEEKWREAAEKDHILDWSGRTTYWIRDIVITKEGGYRLAQELAIAFPGMRILESEWFWGPPRRIYIPRKTVWDCEDSALFGFGANEQRLADLLSRDHVKIADLDQVFAHHLSMRIRWNDRHGRGTRRAAEWAEKIGGHIQLPEIDLLGHLDTKFATGDSARERYARKLVQTVESCFLSWVEEVDLATGDIIGGPRQINWYSLDLRDWCLAAPNRFLSCRAEKDGLRRNIGVRPCHAPI